MNLDICKNCPCYFNDGLNKIYIRPIFDVEKNKYISLHVMIDCKNESYIIYDKDKKLLSDIVKIYNDHFYFTGAYSLNKNQFIYKKRRKIKNIVDVEKKIYQIFNEKFFEKCNYIFEQQLSDWNIK